jgi:hypothetical protein
MDEMLPRQHLAAIVEPPPLEVWRERCRNATDDELRRLRIQALDSLRADGMDQRWSIYVSFAQETMQVRGIKP